MNSRLSKVLLSYRVTPQSTTGLAPTELLLGKRPSTCLHLLKPHMAERVERKQQQQKRRHDGRGQARTFHIGDSIFMRNYGAGAVWLPGKISARSGPVSFHVLGDGRSRHCHQNQLRSRVATDGPPEMSAVPVDGSMEETSSPEQGSV